MKDSREFLEVKLPTGGELFSRSKPAKLWRLGEAAILERKLFGIMSARQIDSDLALKSSRLLKQLASLKDVSFIGGWHSPLEAEALRILLAQRVPIVFCVSKSLDKFVPPRQVGERVSQGRALLLTLCSPKANRISRDASLRRNQLVVDLAEELLFLSAPEGSASLKLARSALRQGKPVHTLEHRLNKELLESGALPATLDKISEALR